MQIKKKLIYWSFTVGEVENLEKKQETVGEILWKVPLMKGAKTANANINCGANGEYQFPNGNDEY